MDRTVIDGKWAAGPLVKVLILAAFSFSQLWAQEEIRLSGTVTNAGGNPVSGAVVTLLGQGLSDTTDEQGNYTILSSVLGIEDPDVRPQLNLHLSGRSVSLKLAGQSRVRIEVFDLGGRLVRVLCNGILNKGSHRLPIGKPDLSNQVHLLRTRLGPRVFWNKILSAGHGEGIITGPLRPEQMWLGKKSGTSVDTLVATHVYYLEARVPVPGYTGVINVVLSPLSGGDLRLHPFSEDSPWNAPIPPDATFRPGSDAAVQNLRDTRAWPYINQDVWSIPVFFAETTDPMTTIGVSWIPQQPSFPNAGPGNVSLNLPGNAIQASGSDGHLVVTDPDGITCHEFYAMNVQNRSASKYVRTDLRGTGIGEKMGDDWSTRAYGGSSLGGLIRKHELEYARIPHAIAFALSRWQLKQGPLYPIATVEDSFADQYSGLIPMGTRVGLPPDIDLDNYDFSPHVRALAEALKIYGGYVVDHASDTWAIYAEVGANLVSTDEEMFTLQSLVTIVDWF
jgi:hypothetical protein